MRKSNCLTQGRFQKSFLTTSVVTALLVAPVLATAAEESPADKQDLDDIIVVTAQKRAQNVMKVPVTVDTISAETIKQSSSVLLSDIDIFIPGFDFSDGNMTQAGVTMRGVSSPNISTGGDPSSATFFDNVYMPRAAQNVLFSDLERVEVLKGPQGTLFGKNAAMGVVNIIPNAPRADFESFVKGTFGTDDLQRLESMINVAITDNVFVRANILQNKQDGFIDNISTPSWNEDHKIWDLGARDHLASRIAVKWEISNRSELQFSYDYDDLEQAPPMAVGFNPYAYEEGRFPFGSKQENDVHEGVESRDMKAYTLKFNHQFDQNWSMMFVTSYREWETINREDEDGTQDITRYLDTSNNEDSDIFYNELQVNYNSDRLNYVGGITYSKEDVFQETEINLTTDTVARLVTEELNGQVYDMLGGEILSQLEAGGVLAMAGGDPDTAAALYACTLQGAPDPTACIGQVTFDDVVSQTYNDMGLEMEHFWNADEWANTLSAMGMGISPEFVQASGDATYDQAAVELGEMLIFGPGFSTELNGLFWSENFYNTGDFTSYGIYSDFDYKLSDAWNVFAGLRYSRDEKDFTWEVTETQFAEIRPGVSNILFPAMPKTSASEEWDKVTGRIGTGYELSDDHMVFISYATGYKAGGYDSLNPGSADEPFEPEESKNYEFGYKGILFDQLRTNLAVYHTELDDQQRNVESKPPGQNQALPTVVNQDLEIDGVELSLVWQVTSSFTAGVVSDYRDTSVDSEGFYNSVGEFIEATSIDGNSNTSYTITLDWMPDLGLGNTLLHIDYVFVENERGIEIGTPEWERNLPNYYDDRKDLNARFSWVDDSDHWEIGIWGKNLLDNDYIETAGGRTAEVLGTPFGRINRGLEAGVDIQYSF